MVQTYHLLGEGRRGRWALLVLLALVMSGVEMLGAVLVYALMALVATPDAALDLPLVGEFHGFVDDGHESTVLWLVAAMGVFFVARALLGVLVNYVQARMVYTAGARLSNELVEGYLRWPYAAHLQRNSAELIRNGHQAVLEIVHDVAMPVIKLAAEGVVVIGMLAVLVVIAPMATALAVPVIGGAAALLLWVVQPRLKRLGIVDHRESQETLQSFQQALHGLRDIKVLGREENFAGRYARSRHRMARARYLHATVEQLPRPVIETSLLGVILLFFAVALLRGGQAQNSLSLLGLFGYVGLRLLPSLQHILRALNSLKYAAAPLDALHEDLVACRASGAVRADAEPLRFQDRLVLEDVSFRYATSERDALSGIDLTIRAGQQIGICGPTGGGKTTLADIVTGLLVPTGGRVLVDGRDLEQHVRGWQRTLGVVPQMVFLTDDTLRANIALGLPEEEVDERALLEAVRHAQLDELVAKLPEGLDTVVGERGVRLSGGQRQRIAIARALYRRPTVLIFDEGTSALDMGTEAQLMASIERLRGDHTIILIAHRLSTVQNSDVVVFLEEGRITGRGTYDELVRDHREFRAMARGGT